MMKRLLSMLMAVVTTVSIQAQSQYLLSVSCNDGGEVAFEGQTVRNGMKQVSVNRNQSVTVSMSPDEGYEIETVTLNEQNVKENLYHNSYTIAQIQENIEFRVTFAKNDRLKSLTAIGLEVRNGRKVIEVPSLWYQPVIAKVGSGPNEEYHYMSPQAVQVYDADYYDGTSYYLFDSGEMAPFFALGGVRSWNDFQMTYGDEDGSYLWFYIMMLHQYTRLKTTKDGAVGSISYQVSPGNADMNSMSFGFHTNIVEWGSGDKRNGNDSFAFPMSSWLDGYMNTLDDGILTIPFGISSVEEYMRQIARTANSEETWNACFDGYFQPMDSGIEVTTDNFLSSTDSLNTISLQARQYGQETIASDEIVVVPSLIFIEAIADNASEVGMLGCGQQIYAGEDDYGWPSYTYESYAHAWKQARTAIRNRPAHHVAYNRSIDLAPFIETHYMKLGSHLNFMSGLDDDEVMSADLFRQLGLRYEFSLVDYEGGVLPTGESVHATLETVYSAEADFGIEKVVLTPRSKGENGELVTDQPAKRDVIGREPLVRITLLDSNNQILQVGYIKLMITDNMEPTSIDEVVQNTKDGYIYNLNGQRVSDKAKGIVIKNGKKVVVR